MNGKPYGGDGTEQRHSYQEREEKEKPKQTPQAIAHTHSRRDFITRQRGSWIIANLIGFGRIIAFGLGITKFIEEANSMQERLRVTVGALLLALASTLVAQAAPLKVGDKAPDFTLPDQNGNKVSLNQFLGKKNVVLAFYVLAFTGG